MHISTSTHVLSLAEDHVYNLRKNGVAGDDSWLESRRGEAFDRKLQVALHDNLLHLVFENKPIGTISINNSAQVDGLIRFVTYWHETIGPTDLPTTRTIEMVRDWPQLRTQREISLKCITYNCAGRLGDTSLRSETWQRLLGDATSTNLICISFQESDNLNRSVKANLLTLQSAVDSSRSYLHKSHSLVSSVQLLGLMTLVFVSHDLAPCIRHVETSTSSTGFLKMWGNKGAVLTRFQLLGDEILHSGVEFAIVNCHLSAGEGIAQLSRRRWELREIGHSFAIPGLTGTKAASYDGEVDDDSDSVSSISSSESENLDMDTAKPPMVAKSRSGSLESVPETLKESRLAQSPPPSFHSSPHHSPHHHSSEQDSEPVSVSSEPEFSLDTRPSKYTILMGDLNYRILLAHSEVEKKVKREEWEGLLAHDSLYIERRQGIVFHDFEEPAIHFAPTYKYEIGSNKLAARVPSYTDRVLYRSPCPTRIESYRSVPDLKFSDHKPVVFTGTLTADTCIDPAAAACTLKRALKISDDAENRARPKLEMSEQQITIQGPPLSLQRYEISLSNGGSRPVKWIIASADAVVEALDTEHADANVSSPPLSPGASTAAPASSPAVPAPNSAPSSHQTPSHSASSPPNPSHQRSASNISVKQSIPILREPADPSLLFRNRHPVDAQPKQLFENVSVIPDHGVLSGAHRTTTLELITQVGLHAREHIALVKNPSNLEDTLQKYLFIKIKPTNSCLGQSLWDMPQDAYGIPIPVQKCVEYLASASGNVPQASTMFVLPAEPSIFQTVLKWIDQSMDFDLEVLKSANDTGNHAGVCAVAQVLLALFEYSPAQVMGPSLRQLADDQSARAEKLRNYVCDFINQRELDDESLDIWASVLYDRQDAKAGKIEKRNYLRSQLIAAGAR